jgi:hypothetical protein
VNAHDLDIILDRVKILGYRFDRARAARILSVAIERGLILAPHEIAIATDAELAAWWDGQRNARVRQLPG